MISQLRALTTKKGDPMAFGTLEDLTGRIEVVFFPRTWAECRHQVAVDQVMLVFGKIQGPEEGRGDQIKMLVDRVDLNPMLPSAVEERFAPAAPPWSPDEFAPDLDEENGEEEERGRGGEGETPRRRPLRRLALLWKRPVPRRH
jgi:DNA polymerase III alpha subunit